MKCTFSAREQPDRCSLGSLWGVGSAHKLWIRILWFFARCRCSNELSMPGNNQINAAWVTVEEVLSSTAFCACERGFQLQNPIGGNLGRSKLVAAVTLEMVLLMVFFSHMEPGFGTCKTFSGVAIALNSLVRAS